MTERPEITIVRRDIVHQSSHALALASGMKAHGVGVKIATPSHRIVTKYTACWGWRLGVRLRQAGHEVLVMERGYVGDRFAYTSLGWNGLNGFANFPKREADSGERFSAHGGKLLPWKNTGEYVLILGQVPRDASLRGIDLLPKYEAWAQACAKTYKLPVLFRPHPDLAKKGIRQTLYSAQSSPHKSLAEALDGAAMCVTFNSNSSVDSVLAGVPTVALDSGSMAWDVCGHSLDEIVRPDRTVWAHKLAFKQWSMDEIKNGAALEPFVDRMTLG